MDFGKIVDYLFQSNMDNKIVRIYENTGNEYQGKVLSVKFKSQRFEEEQDYCEIQIENGKEYLIFIDNIEKIEISDDLDRASLV